MDIVERLRKRKEQYIATVEWGLGTWEELADSDRPDEDCQEAADEIERLRDVLQSISNNTCCDNCQEAALVARAALKEKE